MVYMIAWVSHMAKVCAITKKGSKMAGGYSNVVRATKFNPTGMVRKYTNLQKKLLPSYNIYPGNKDYQQARCL